MQAITSHAFWIDSPHTGSIHQERCSAPTAEMLQVRTLYSGISRGTEALVWNGLVPESEYQRMRAPFQSGEFPGPVKYGYANTGVVEAGPADWMGARVFCLYPHQDRYVVPLAAVHRLPDALPAERAILAANVETAINAIWDLQPQLGERVAVIGAGVVGCLVASLIQAIPGCQAQLIDINPARSTIAAALGVEFATPDTAWPQAARVVHTSATQAGLEHALSIAATNGTVLEMSWFGKTPVSLPLGQDFHARRLTLRSSQVGQVPPPMASQWSTTRRLDLALSLLAENTAWERLIDGESAFADLPQTMPEIASGHGLCHRIIYPETF